MKKLILHKSIFIVLLLIVVFLQSCVKDSNSVVITYPGPSFDGNIKNVYTNARDLIKPENIIINCSQENTINTNKGIRVNIPANSFINTAGVPISGDVNISVYVLTKKSEWVSFSQFSNTSDQLIDWYKTLSVQASYNGVALKLIPGKILTIQLPEDNPSVNWKLFNGEYISTRTFLTSVSPNGYNFKTWTDNQGVTVKGLEFPISSLNWIGIGTILPNPPKSQIQINLPANYYEFNTAVIAVNPADNVIYYLNNINASSNTFRGYLHTLKNITLVVLSEQDNSSYYGSKDYYEELTPDTIIDKEPGQKSILEIEEYINAL
ncbi:MAG TPA: hypothetical protein VK590_04950 [Saprospiraceae bacterium]|nr:hypothetical protein [Saprospiraceae bacterium]